MAARNRMYDMAIFKNGDIFQKLHISQINAVEYSEKYRGHLFCPNERCGARLKLVQRKQGAVALLQSIDIKEHIKGCPYFFEYKKYDTDEKVNKTFSDSHIETSLKRQMQQFGAKQTKKYKRIPTKNKPNRRRYEPQIQYYPCEHVDESLIGKAISVGGYIHSVNTVGNAPDNIHTYMNFHMNSEPKVKILISNALYQRESETSDVIQEINKDFKNKPNEMDLACVCFGRVYKVATGINIVPTRLIAIRTGWIKKKD